MWRSASEVWLVTRDMHRLDAVLECIERAPRVDVHAVDHSEGTVGVELQDGDVEGVLARLADATVIPRDPGQATRACCAELAIVLMRIDAHRLWLLVDRPCVDYLLSWLDHATGQYRHGSRHVL